MESLKELVLFYTSHLYLVDYMLILFVFFLFTCVLLLCVFLRHRPITALLIIALDIIACFFIYIYGYKFIDGAVRSRQVALVDEKKVESLSALVVDFNITNTSKRNFKDCKVLAKIYKNPNPNDNILNRYKNRFIPYRQKSREFKELNKSITQSQRITFDNFEQENNYTIKLDSECF